MDKEEILYNEIYERTKDFGRAHFIKEIMRLQREIKELKEKHMKLEDKYINNVSCCNEEDCDLFCEHQELKLELSGYRQAILEDKDMLGLKEENQELKKQYCERTDCSGRLGNSKKVEQLEKELEQLKEINEEHKKLNGELREENQKYKEVIDKAIEYLEPFVEIDMCTIKGTMLKKPLKILKGEPNNE